MSCAISRGDFPEWRKTYPPRRDLRRLTPEQVALIRAAPDGYGPALAREFTEAGTKISSVAVWKIKRRITYRDLP